ncbi:uncharacterized protein LOC106964320 [Poecilia latipinna]|uniref:uncharacterized protein LOC106964320 n=1 Tax=Poecilia latipinna TaxID=48699 RepID=UPI00072DC243|nr:PREDICTED: uncharacterized protein LOC106964320 [Poecilia latipinna]
MPPSVGANLQSVYRSCQFNSNKLRPPPPLKPTSLTVAWTPFFSCLKDFGTMLIKTRLGELQKFVRLTEPNLKEFLIAAFTKFGVPAITEGVKVVDSSGTELDEDVFEDVVKDPSAGVLTIKYETEFVSMVESPEESQPSSSDSQETLILSESPSAKRQRLDTEAKHVRMDLRKTKKEHLPKKHRVNMGLEDQLLDGRPSLFQRLS